VHSLNAASPTVCFEESFVTSRATEELTAVEREVIGELRALRAAPRNDLHGILFDDPARLLHHFILIYHGNVQIRLGPLAREIGVEMRTLERKFIAQYNKTPLQFQVDVRLSFSQWLLSIFPPTKISAIATILGYTEVRDFNRFFRKHMHQRPSEWGRAERERIEREVIAVSRAEDTQDL
jgi:AraC-like DNA-binding protein